MGLKIYNFCCEFGHVFEGWYRSDDAWKEDLKNGRLSCPVCGNCCIAKRPSAPNFSKVSGTTRTDVDGDVAARKQTVLRDMQARAMSVLRDVAAQAEDVGERFPDAVRAIHDGRADRRLVKGTCSNEEAEALREEGIPVMPLPDSVVKPLN